MFYVSGSCFGDFSHPGFGALQYGGGVTLLHVVHFAPYWGLGGVRTLAYFRVF